VDIDVAYVDMLLWLYTHVLRVYFKYFICFSVYVANVSSFCFKSRSGVTRVAMRAGG
jgi:hypothetical protein